MKKDNIISKKIDSELNKAIRIKELVLKEKLSYKKTQELRKQQNEAFEKVKFLKQLKKAIQKNKNMEEI